VVRIPSFSRRPDGSAGQDDDGDGRIDERDASAAGTRPVTTGSSTYRGGASPSDTRSPAPQPARHESTADSAAADRARAAERATAGGAADAEPHRTAAGTATVDPDAPHRAPDEEVTVVAGPRPRASLLATLSLIAGVAAALFVLSGALAGYGIALGALALLLSFGGMSATSRRHIAGKSDALFGLILGLGAIALGILAVTDQLAWPTTESDTVQRFREWLDAQFVDRF
jgi:hypothetical protein